MTIRETFGRLLLSRRVLHRRRELKAGVSTVLRPADKRLRQDEIEGGPGLLRRSWPSSRAILSMNLTVATSTARTSIRTADSGSGLPKKYFAESVPWTFWPGW